MTQPSAPIAAVDLGSNSFHLVVAHQVGGQLRVIDRLREIVRLAGGLDAQQRLTASVQKQALECLARFGQRLRNMPSGSVRAAGTNTLRVAINAEDFLAQAETALGHPIAIIPGIEEARLIFVGVAHTLPVMSGRRLVIDIGGGSTELIIGERYTPTRMESLHMGCVSMSLKHLRDGHVRARDMEHAEIAARVELQQIAQQFRHLGWEEAVGASGTVRATARIVQAEGWCSSGISREALRKVRAAITHAGDVAKIKLATLGADRAPVFPGGVAILGAIMDALNINHLKVADGALREGLLYDQISRIQHDDTREATVHTLMVRYHVDAAQAQRVATTGYTCLAQIADAWNLDDEDAAASLGWAARLHEIGLSIAHNGYHKHGAYLAAHGDLPGFSQHDQQLLAALIRGHRRKFPVEEFAALPRTYAERVRRLCIVLRLAVLLHRGRNTTPLPEITLSVTKQGLRMEFPAQWLAQHPLTAAELAAEAEQLKAINVSFNYA